MPTLTDYAQFHGRHWETGSVANHLAYQGITAPHTNAPYSEAFLLGVSGGLAFGYFTFHYEGHDPQCNLLTRNTFDPLGTMLSRLGIVQTVLRTGKPDTAVAHCRMRWWKIRRWTGGLSDTAWPKRCWPCMMRNTRPWKRSAKPCRLDPTLPRLEALQCKERPQILGKIRQEPVQWASQTARQAVWHFTRLIRRDNEHGYQNKSGF